jgi:hypothetical protein
MKSKNIKMYVQFITLLPLPVLVGIDNLDVAVAVVVAPN